MDRLDKLLLARYPDFSRSRIEGLVKAGYVTVNGAAASKAGMKVSEDDEIEVEIPPPVPAIPEPEDIPLDIVYEDADMLVVNKAPGMVVHPAPGHFTGTLVNALLHHCPDLSGIGGVARPGIVHRLDQFTSGLIVVAKSQPAMDGLVKAFASHTHIEKTYLAICHGRPRLDSGRIENLIGRHPVDRKRMAIVERNGKVAITNWAVLKFGSLEGLDVWKFGGLEGLEVEVHPNIQTSKHPNDQTPKHPNIQTSKHPNIQTSKHPNIQTPKRPNAQTSILQCRIETGRTHQIRVHVASLGCPVIGDAVYGKSALDKKLDPVPRRQMLHAWKLTLWHPVKNEKMTFVAPPPDDMQPYLG